MGRRDDELFAHKPRREVAFDFVLDALSASAPATRAMFGATAVYLDERVVFILREKGDADDGVWVAFEPEREAAVMAALPRLQSITLFGKIRGWKKLYARDPSFEDDVLAACALARGKGALLGKVPARQKAKAGKGSAAKPAARRVPPKRR
jgi:hypothetical protein